jgi:hypothetical protein
MPSVIFLDRMDDAMSGLLSTVAVASRNAYILRSAGATSAVWRIKTQPVWASALRIAARLRSVRNPGIEASLSSVPPVCPRPRPDIIGTIAPHAAARGARMSDVLSPTPPVECLSTATVPLEAVRSDQSNAMPDSTMACVRSVASSMFMPLRKMAIRSAET